MLDGAIVFHNEEFVQPKFKKVSISMFTQELKCHKDFKKGLFVTCNTEDTTQMKFPTDFKIENNKLENFEEMEENFFNKLTKEKKIVADYAASQSITLELLDQVAKDILKEDYMRKCKMIIKGMTTTYSYFGTKFSHFPWHLEDSGTCSISYNILGAAKLWYLIPNCYCMTFYEEVAANTKMPPCNSDVIFHRNHFSDPR